MAHTHYDDHGSGEGFAAASWMLAMMAVIVFAVLAVAMLVWAPWNDGTTTTNTNTGDNTEQQAPADEGDGINIEGNDVDVNGDDVPVPGQ